MIWHLIVSFGLVLWNGDSDIQLEGATEFSYLDWRNMQVARDGSLLYADGPELWHWDEKGELLRILTKDAEGHAFGLIPSFYFDAGRGVYWIIDSSRSRSSFFDRKGDPLGFGYHVPADPQVEGTRQVYYRFLIPVGSRIFVLDDRDLGEWSSPKVLQQVDFKKTESGVEVWPVGPAFGEISSRQKAYNYDFKRHWIVQSGYSKTFMVVDQLSTHIRFFEPKPRASISDGLYPRDKAVPIVMRERVPPPPPEKGRECDTQECFSKWFNSFTRIEGFFPLGSDYLVGYGIPPERAGEVRRLGLQKIDGQGIARGKSQILDGYLMGTWRDRVYVLTEEGPPGNKTYRVSKLSL